MVSISTGKDSKQDYQTPPEFIKAVEARFGKILFDLAASAHNTQHPDYFNEATDSLKQDWAALAKTLHHKPPGLGLLWLNPPFANITPWAHKCMIECVKSDFPWGIRIAFLVPASVGSRWFADYVSGEANVFFLTGRLSFDGKAPFMKDCLLALYGPRTGEVMETWDWRK